MVFTSLEGFWVILLSDSERCLSAVLFVNFCYRYLTFENINRLFYLLQLLWKWKYHWLRKKIVKHYLSVRKCRTKSDKKCFSWCIILKMRLIRRQTHRNSLSKRQFIYCKLLYLRCTRQKLQNYSFWSEGTFYYCMSILSTLKTTISITSSCMGYDNDLMYHVAIIALRRVGH